MSKIPASELENLRSTSLNLYTNLTLTENGIGVTDAEVVDVTWDATNNWKNLNAVAAAFGTVLYRYSGSDFVSFIINNPDTTKYADSSSFEIITIDFRNPEFGYAEALTQVEACNTFYCLDDLKALAKNDVQNVLKYRVAGTQNSNLESKFQDFKIQVEVTPGAKSFSLRMNFQTANFSMVHMKRFNSHVAALIRKGSKCPNDQVENLRMLGTAEEDNILIKFNEINTKDLQIFENDASLFGVFYENIIEWGEKLALLQETQEGEIRLTYRELYTRVNDLSKVINEFKAPECGQGQGSNSDIKPRQSTLASQKVVAILLPEDLSFIVASLASLLIGKSVAKFSNGFDSNQVDQALTKLGFPTLVTTSAFQDKIGLAYENTLLISDQGISDLSKNTVPSRPVHNFKFPATEIPYRFLTADSIGQIKLNSINQSTILNRINFAAKQSWIDSASRSALICNSLYDSWSTWLVGGSLYIPTEDTKLDFTKCQNFLQLHEITNLHTSTAMLDHLLNKAENENSLPKLKSVSTTGEKLKRVDLLAQNFNISYWYCSLEGHGICANYLQSGKYYEDPSRGTAISNISVYILDTYLKAIPTGIAGDIYVSGVGITTGKIKVDDENYIVSPFEVGAKLYRTGDVGYWTDDGQLYVLGKKSAQTIVHGKRLELHEIERQIENISNIENALVKVQEVNNSKQLIAFCSLKDPKIGPSEAEIQSILASTLPQHVIPSKFLFVSDFAKNISGKIDPNAPFKFLNEENTSEAFPQVRNLWASVLGIPSKIIQSDSDFFSIGGNSLKATELTLMLRTKFPKIRPFELFEFPVLKTFVDSLEIQDLTITETDFQKEVLLNLNVSPSLIGSKAESIKKSLLTGSTGYFGPALLLQLLFSTKQTIVCIIRAKNSVEAKKKLEARITSYKFNQMFHNLSKTRLVILAGDLTLPQFGLTYSAYKELCSTTDAIYHLAAEVNQLKTYEELKLTTVAMVKNVLEFATTDKLKWVHHVSSLAVFDEMALKDGSEKYIAHEEFLPHDVVPARLRNGYVQSKWVSEQLVRKALEGGVPGRIYRVGQIGSHSSLPVVNTEGALGAFLLACKRIEKYPHVSCVIPFVRLDTAAKMLYDYSESGLKSTESKHVFHVSDADVTLSEFLDADASGNYESVSLSNWEREFNSQCRWNCNKDLSTLAFLNYLKYKENLLGESNDMISYTFKSSIDAMLDGKAKILSSYFRTLLNASH